MPTGTALMQACAPHAEDQPESGGEDNDADDVRDDENISIVDAGECQSIWEPPYLAIARVAWSGSCPTARRRSACVGRTNRAPAAAKRSRWAEIIRVVASVIGRTREAISFVDCAITSSRNRSGCDCGDAYWNVPAEKRDHPAFDQGWPSPTKTLCPWRASDRTQATAWF